ncbi:MAG: DUF5995 family protein [Bacillota bacterium]
MIQIADSMRSLIGQMEKQLRRFDETGDHRAAFLRVYTHMSRRVLRRMEAPAFFLDPAWIERVAIRFAQMYFDALHAFDQGRPTPPAWRLAFETAAGRRAFLLEDVVLGVNAHINSDLPQVLAAILREEGDWGHPGRMLRRRFDHDQINRILAEIIQAVEGEVADHDGRLVRYLGWAMGRLDEILAALGLKRFRDDTWREAEFLLAADSEEERAEVRHWVEQDALRAGQQVLRLGAPAWARPAAGIARRLRLF